MSDLQNLIAAIDRNTAAVTALAGACAGTVEVKTKRTRAAADAPAAPETPAQTPAAAPAAAPAAQTAPPAQNGAAPASAASAAGGTGPSLQMVADAIIDLANTVSREAAVEILTRYGAAKVPQIKASDFRAVLADVATKKAGGSLSAPASAGLM